MVFVDREVRSEQAVYRSFSGRGGEISLSPCSVQREVFVVSLPSGSIRQGHGPHSARPCSYQTAGTCLCSWKVRGTATKGTGGRLLEPAHSGDGPRGLGGAGQEVDDGGTLSLVTRTPLTDSAFCPQVVGAEAIRERLLVGGRLQRKDRLTDAGQTGSPTLFPSNRRVRGPNRSRHQSPRPEV